MSFDQVDDLTQRQVDAVRAFNRFYTRQIGVLDEHLHDSPFSLTELRVLYELANSEQPTPTAISNALALDAGYLSRILRRFEGDGYIARRPSARDGRSTLIELTPVGRNVYERYNRRSHDQMAELLGALSRVERQRLVNSLAVAQTLLGAQPPGDRADCNIRSHRAGDIGWVVQRHGELYADEYGWNEQFEALVAEIAAKFVQNFDPAREGCWIAECHGENVGCIFLVRNDEETAQLRLFLVQPDARGQGIGQRLLSECLGFARKAGYARVVLWTNALLVSAHRLYEGAGFRLVTEETQQQLGMAFTAQTWQLDLR